jgi:hypothetical protein
MSKKIKILIQVFSLVKEIDYLERTLLLLKQNSLFIDKEKYHVILDVNFLISDYLTDWDKSILKQDYFTSRLKHLEKYYADWYDECHFDTDETVKGALGYFIKNSLTKYQDVDSIILLEPDVIFNPYTLNLFLESIEQVKTQSPNYIITAEYVKMWDSSWDIVVNSKFINEPFTYRNTLDPVVDSYFINGEVNLKPLIYNNTKHFKFGGGWFTMYSKSLFDLIDFPKTLDGYGPLDNYVMNFCYHQPHLVTQYKIENLIITDYHNDTTYYDNYIFNHDKKQDLYQKNNDIMIKHFKNKFGF